LEGGKPLTTETGPKEELYRFSLAASRLFSRSIEAPLEETFSLLADLLVSELGARIVLIGCLDRTSLALKILAVSGQAAGYAENLQLSSDPDNVMGQGPAGEVLRSGHPLVVNLPIMLSRPGMEDFRNRVERFGIGGSAIVPIRTREGVWGLINVYRGGNDSFSPDILPLLESFSDDLAGFLDRREAARELSVRRTFQGAIEDLQTLFLSGPEEEAIDQALVEALVDKVGLPAGWIMKAGSGPSSQAGGSGVFYVRNCAARDIRLQTALKNFSFTVDLEHPERGPLFSEKGEQGYPLVLALDSHPAFKPLLAGGPFSPELSTAVALPLSVSPDGSFDTVLMVGFEKKRAPSGETLGLLGQISSGAKMALNQRRDKQILERYSAFYRAIGEASQLMARHPDPEDLFDHICEILVASTGIPLAFVSLIEAGMNVRVVSAKGKARTFVEGAVFSIDPMDPGRCLIHSRTLEKDTVCSIPFLEGWLCSDAVRELARPYRLKHTLTISLRKDGQRIGILALISDEERFFDRTLEDLLEGLSRDITFSLEAHDRQERLVRLSLTDGLTGLPNRTSFQEEVSAELLRSKTSGSTFSISILDLDGFKGWNDTFGHAEGDRLLKNLASRLSGLLKAGDRLARLGGDEFGFLRTGASRSELKEFSKEILRTVEAIDPEMNIVTGSLGWASYPEDGESYRDLLAHADESLYAAKRSGRNTFRFFGGEIALALHRRIEIHRDFPGALQKEEIHFYLQPQVDCRTGSVEGVEMLARWKSGSKILPPGVFMPEVEKDPKLIRALGRYALRHAVALRKRLSCAGMSHRVSLNIGASHFLHTAFMEDVEESLAGGSGAGLAIEVTESVALEDMTRTTRVIEQLKKRNFGVSLDDFGTGYSSLHYAADLAMTEIKLDQYFIRRFRNHTNAFAVVSATLLLSSLSGSALIAEGIEFPEDLDLWLRMGGSKVQGYLVAKPMPEEIFMEWNKTARFDFLSRIPPVYPVEDMTFLEYAFRQKENFRTPWNNFFDCPLESWFEARGFLYKHLPSWNKAREIHRDLHRQSDQDHRELDPEKSPAPSSGQDLSGLVESFYQNMCSLREEVEEDLRSLFPPRT